MKERPILFSAPMVRALLAGTKTQTRRVVKRPLMCLCNHPIEHHIEHQGWTTLGACAPFQRDWFASPCPYGQPGDRLWVRETWQHSNHPYGPADESCAIFYRADYWDDPHGMDGEKSPEGKYREWRPSIHMFRWASRILLEIVSVRVERLHDISEADALEEGITYNDIPNNGLDPMRARTWYRRLWDSINGPGSWDANPFVWVVEFKRAKP